MKILVWEMRTSKGFTLMELSKKSGIGKSTINNIENGKVSPTLFAWLARVISFEAFSMMVDEALERMKKMLESNKAMQTLVSGEAGEVNE